MVDLRGLKEIKYKAAELEEWTKVAYVAEETIMQISKYIKEYGIKRSEAAKDPKYQARFDIEIAKLEKHRAEQEMKKAKALEKMKDIIKEIINKFGR